MSKINNTALLVVDVQNDFCPGGALAVPAADAIVPLVNAWVAAAIEQDTPVLLSQDWHPSDHCSFSGHGGPWPRHCVQNSWGAQLHPGLLVPEQALIVRKAFDPQVEMYSAISGCVSASASASTAVEQQGAALYAWLQQQGIKRLYVLGIALEYCVYASVQEALEHGLAVSVIVPACASMHPERLQHTLAELEAMGAELLQQDAVLFAPV